MTKQVQAQIGDKTMNFKSFNTFAIHVANNFKTTVGNVFMIYSKLRKGQFYERGIGKDIQENVRFVKIADEVIIDNRLNSFVEGFEGFGVL